MALTYKDFNIKKGKLIEKKIQFHAILIYVIVAFLCGAMFIYLYSQKASIGSQRQNIQKNRKTLTLTNNLISSVNYTQAKANLYLTSKKPEYILQFVESIQKVQASIDSLRLSFPQAEQKSILNDIDSLLTKKAIAITALNLQFDNYNMVDSISKKIRQYELSLLDNAVEQSFKDKITTIFIKEKNDTIRKKFLQRLAEAFVPEKKSSKYNKEVIITKGDTLNINPGFRADSLSVLSDLLSIANKNSKKYNRQIIFIEKQVAALMVSDHEISMQLSNLLINLHQQTIDSTMQGIEKSEKIIYQNYINSIIGSLLSLALILILIVFIIKNVSKGKKMLEMLEQANTRTQSIFESRHNLILSISHDIKTPINSIIGYLDLWEREHTLSSKEIFAMKQSGKYILELTKNLLEFSRLDQGAMQITPVDFQLYELCTETAEVFKPFALNKKIAFNVHLNFDHALRFHSDAIKIKQIIINILSNAVKYTVEGHVELDVKYIDGHIHFNISDTGKGIPEEQIDTIFEPFRRVEENNFLASGSGFGLFVAKGMTELLNGTITVRSIVNKGTSMKVIIPAQAVQAVEAKAREIKSKRIFIMDDDIVFLSMLQKMLSKLGHQADTCYSLETFNKLSKYLSNYDVVLTDADMVTFSGMDILQKIKAQNIKLPVALMSGQGNLTHEKVKEYGFDDFLPKPISITSLRQLFGGNENVSDTLYSLEELFDGNMEAIQKILDAFIDDTQKHIGLLELALEQNNLQKAQQICHKMLPMFMQLKVIKAVVILSRVNGAQNDFLIEDDLWKKEIRQLINIVKDFVNEIEQERGWELEKNMPLK